jgi:hypothetical protein
MQATSPLRTTWTASQPTSIASVLIEGARTMIKRGVQLRAEAAKAPEKLEKFKNVSGIDPCLM